MNASHEIKNYNLHEDIIIVISLKQSLPNTYS